MPQSHQSQPAILGMSRRMLLRWLGLYFMLFSLILVMGGLVLLGSAGDGALAGLGGAAIAIVLLAALLNFGLGLLGLLLSFWGRRAVESGGNWPRRRGLRFVYRAILGLLGAAVLYSLSGAISLLAVVFVVEHWAGWWYGWRMPQVQMGDSRQQVEELVGRGSFSAECSSPYARNYSRGTDLERCASVALYYEYNRVGWEIAYDAQDRVVSKLRVRP